MLSKQASRNHGNLSHGSPQHDVNMFGKVLQRMRNVLKWEFSYPDQRLLDVHVNVRLLHILGQNVHFDLLSLVFEANCEVTRSPHRSVLSLSLW